jgi:hypothetical protein
MLAAGSEEQEPFLALRESVLRARACQLSHSKCALLFVNLAEPGCLQGSCTRLARLC